MLNIRITRFLFSSLRYGRFISHMYVCVISVRIWDVRPYAPHERCVKIMSGHQHTFEKVYQWINIKEHNYFFFPSLFFLGMGERECRMYRAYALQQKFTHKKRLCYNCLIDGLYCLLQCGAFVIFFIEIKNHVRLCDSHWSNWLTGLSVSKTGRFKFCY